MKKSRKIVYWVATLWLSLGLVATGILQILGTTQGMGGSEMMIKLGYPLYLMPLLGVLKILAVVTLLMPALRLVKQWSYAGIFFLMVGAIYSHIASGDLFVESLPALLLMTLMAISWYYLPENRKVSVFLNNTNL